MSAPYIFQSRMMMIPIWRLGMIKLKMLESPAYLLIFKRRIRRDTRRFYFKPRHAAISH